MPGVRPSESWRDWNEQSFSQSGREGGGVGGGVFISKIRSQSHAASHLWTYFVRCYQRRPGRAAKRDTIVDWPLRLSARALRTDAERRRFRRLFSTEVRAGLA